MMESQTERPSYVKWNDIEVEQLNPLIGRQFVVGKNVMIARVLLEKGANVPLHQHHNEQVTYIPEGALASLLSASSSAPAKSYVFRPMFPTNQRPREDTVDLDVFNLRVRIDGRDDAISGANTAQISEDKIDPGLYRIVIVAFLSEGIARAAAENSPPWARRDVLSRSRKLNVVTNSQSVM